MLELGPGPRPPRRTPPKLHQGRQAANGCVSARRPKLCRAPNARSERAFTRTSTRAKLLFATHALYAGVWRVTTDASRLAALAKLPGVKAIHPLSPKSGGEHHAGLQQRRVRRRSGGLAGPAEHRRRHPDRRQSTPGSTNTHADFGRPGHLRGPTPRRWLPTTPIRTIRIRPRCPTVTTSPGDDYNATPGLLRGRRRPTTTRWTATATAVTSRARWAGYGEATKRLDVRRHLRHDAGQRLDAGSSPGVAPRRHHRPP